MSDRITEMLARLMADHIGHGMAEKCEPHAAAIAPAFIELVEALKAESRKAFNEGFNEGIREVQTSRGGKSYAASKANARVNAILSKYTAKDNGNV